MANLIEQRDEAWKEFADFDALEWYPRLYRKHHGQAKPFINPFTSLEERNELATKRRELWLRFLGCQFQVYKEGLSTELKVYWIREDTPDGERWRRIA